MQLLKTGCLVFTQSYDALAPLRLLSESIMCAFSWLGRIPLHGLVRVWLTIHHLKDIYVVSGSGLLQMKLLLFFINKAEHL